MKVVEIKENEDGSADVTFEMSEEEREELVRYAIMNILTKEIKRCNSENTTEG